MATRKPRREAAPTTADPLEIAMDAAAKGAPPEGAAHRILIEQARLIRLQIVGERLSNGLKMLTGLAGFAAAATLGVMVWQASQYQGLVVEPFSVPPELAQSGLTGEVAASRVLDRLAAMQAGTNSVRASASYARSWGRDIEVEIPETGVSLGELQRQLRSMFGRETRVAGEIVRQGAGLSVTARSDGAAGSSFAGAEAELDTLIAKAAEDVYRRTQPYRYSVWLRAQDRRPESREVLLAVAGSGTTSDRAWTNIGLANVAGMQEGPDVALNYLERAEALAPQIHLVSYNIGGNRRSLGQDEGALERYQGARKLLNNRRSAEISLERLESQTDQNNAIIAGLTGNHAEAARIWEKTFADGLRSTGGDFQAELALSQVALHRASDAQATLRALNPTEGVIGPLTVTFKLLAEARAREAKEDWAGVLALEPEGAAFAVAYPGAAKSVTVLFHPHVAYAKARSGDLAGARAMIGAAPLSCVGCVVMRGKIEELAGNRAVADHWFGQATKIAPSIPFAPTEWGWALLARGEVETAIEKFEIAHKRGPKFADPLTGWGEALLSQGKGKAALEKFREADRYAPEWGRNHLFWSGALAQMGRRAQAQAQRQIAARLELTPTERRLLTGN